MVENVRKILDNDIQEIIKSPDLSMLLLVTYSKLYLNGSQPRSCERSQREYYNKLKQNGMEKAAQKKTCVAKYKGLRFFNKLQAHVNMATISDQDALKGLIGGYMKEDDFITLPEDYKKKTEPKKKTTKKKETPKASE